MMKNLIAITCFVVALVSCNKVEHKLEGKWQLKTVEAVSYTHLTLPTIYSV